MNPFTEITRCGILRFFYKYFIDRWIFRSCGAQVFMCPSQTHFIFLYVLICSHNFVHNLSDRFCWYFMNKKCGSRVRPTRYAPPAANDTGTAMCQDGSDSLRLITWPCDLDLWPWRSCACGWCGSSSSIRIPSLKFVGLAIRKIRCTMCVSINGPDDPDLWPFDRETGVRVASKTGNLLSKFGHARPSGSRVIRYVRDGRTDRRTDGRTNAKLTALFPTGGGGVIMDGRLRMRVRGSVL